MSPTHFNYSGYFLFKKPLRSRKLETLFEYPLIFPGELSMGSGPPLAIGGSLLRASAAGVMTAGLVRLVAIRKSDAAYRKFHLGDGAAVLDNGPNSPMTTS
jgi:hypothetical protein